MIDQVAVQRELSDEGIDLSQRQRDGRPSLDVLADEAVRKGAHLKRRLRGLIDDGDTMFLGQGEDPEDLPDAMSAVMRVEIAAERADRWSRGGRAAEQRQGRGRCSRRLIADLDAMPATRGAQVLAQQVPRLGIDESDVQLIPLHVDVLSDPARRRAVIRGLDLHAAIEVHRADAKAIVPKRFERQRAERRSLLRKHRGDLAFRRAMDARVGPVFFPAIEIGLRRFNVSKRWP